MDLKMLSEKKGPDIKLFKVRFRTYLKESTNEKSNVVVLESEDSANVIAVTKDRKVVCVRQFRYGIREWTLELPGGFVESGESTESAAKRELLEETGYRCTAWHYLGKMPSNPVYQDSFIHHFIAFDAEKVSEPKLDPAESIEIELVPLEECLNIMTANHLTHPHSITAFVLGKDFI